MVETTKGLHVKDYNDLDLSALEEIICLNEQLENNLAKIRVAVNDGICHQALYMIDNLIEDTSSHTTYCKKCQENILSDMEERAREDG